LLITFNPKSVAVIGASKDPRKVGFSILQNLKDYGYSGGIYPVNPTVDSIIGIKCFDKVSSIPGTPDLAVIAVPRELVLDVIRDCGIKGVRAAIVITSGFKETGEDGQILESRLLELAKSFGMRILGPNSHGHINTGNGLNASIAPTCRSKAVSPFSHSPARCAPPSLTGHSPEGSVFQSL
jgi:acyl-CoA synthetase (NDP forming)